MSDPKLLQVKNAFLYEAECAFDDLVREAEATEGEPNGTVYIHVSPVMLRAAVPYEAPTPSRWERWRKRLFRLFR